MTGFWRNWLAVWSVGVVLFGMILVLAGFEETLTLPQFILDHMYSHGPVLVTEPLRFAIGLLGAVTLALGLLVYVAVRAATALGPAGRPIWLLVVQTLLIWYVVDSVISCANGFVLNAVSNTIFIILLLVPIYASGVLAAPRAIALP